MPPPIEPDDPRTELDWIAFRYCAGELSEADRLGFETRLADDQSAREALAAAVELVGAVRLAEAPRRERVAAWSRWAVLAAAASVAAAFWIGSDRQPRPTANAVALAWSGLRQPAALNDEPIDSTRDDEAVDVSVSEEVPGWLFDALEAPEPVL